MKLEAIVWDDSTSMSGWVKASSLPTESDLIHSVGWVVSENKKCVVLASHVVQSEEDPQVDGHITIPKCAIVKRRKIAWPFSK